jgi:DNA end-binding protein Ku
VTPQEVTLATKLLGSLEGPFEPENYADGYQARRAELLDKKQKGETVTATPAPTPRAPAVDMLAALQASLDVAASKRGRPAVQ